MVPKNGGFLKWRSTVISIPNLVEPYYPEKYKPTTESISPTRSLNHRVRPALIVGQSTERNEVVVALCGMVVVSPSVGSCLPMK